MTDLTIGFRTVHLVPHAEGSVSLSSCLALPVKSTTVRPEARVSFDAGTGGLFPPILFDGAAVTRGSTDRSSRGFSTSSDPQCSTQFRQGTRSGCQYPTRAVLRESLVGKPLDSLSETLQEIARARLEVGSRFTPTVPQTHP